jgi:transcriptional regulator NrdR family protein
MKCPKCGAEKTRVRVTNDHGASVERLRQCEICRTYFMTNEEEAAREPRIRRP